MPKDTRVAAQLEIKPTAAMGIRTLTVIGSAVFLSLLLTFLLFGGDNDLFAQRATITTFMPEATGLGTDSEVRLDGIRIGKVDEVGFSGLLDPQRAIRVKIRILKRYLKSIPLDSQTDIDKDTLVGYAFVDINLGKSPEPVGEDGVLQSEPLKKAEDRADELRVVQDNFAKIDALLAEAASPETRIGAVVQGSDEYNKLLDGVAKFDRTLHSLVTPQSQLGQAFFSLEGYNKIHSLVTGVDDTLRAIQNGEGVAGRLFASDDQYNAFLRQLSDLNKTLVDLNAGKGQLGEMLQDDATYQRVQRLLASTDASLASLNAGEGRVGQLLASQQLYESLHGSLVKMQALFRDVREDPRKYMRIKIF